MEMNKWGLVDKETVEASGKPVFEYKTWNDELGISMDYFTYSDLQECFKIKLTDEQRKSLVRAWIKKPRMQGFAPLYSGQEVMYLYFGWSYRYIPACE